jgi:hypothetical protein
MYAVDGRGYPLPPGILRANFSAVTSYGVGGYCKVFPALDLNPKVVEIQGTGNRKQGSATADDSIHFRRIRVKVVMR